MTVTVNVLMYGLPYTNHSYLEYVRRSRTVTLQTQNLLHELNQSIIRLSALECAGFAIPSESTVFMLIIAAY